MALIRDEDNTIYFSVHAEEAVNGVTVYLDTMRDQSGVILYKNTLYVVAVIFWPCFAGHIWHIVTHVADQDYPVYKELFPRNTRLDMAITALLQERGADWIASHNTRFAVDVAKLVFPLTGENMAAYTQEVQAYWRVYKASFIDLEDARREME